MELEYLVLLILAIAYVPIYVWVWRSPRAAALGLVKYGPCVMIKTKWGTGIMDRLSVYRRFWRFFGAFSIAASFFLMGFILLIILIGLTNLPVSLAASGIGVQYALAIPGLNPLIPLVYGWLGLVVAMVVHELAHGMQTRANDMRVDSTGVLYGVVPLGAFVEPNEADIAKSTRRAKLDLYSAGISTNLIVAVGAFLVFAVLMLGNVSSSYGGDVGVYRITEDSPALHAGIPGGAIIEYIEADGSVYAYAYDSDYTVTYDHWSPGEAVTVSYIAEDGRHEAEMRWGLFIEAVMGGSPAAGDGEGGGLKARTFILSITVEGRAEAPMYGYSEFLSFMQTTRPGDEAEVLCMTADGSETFTRSLTLGDRGGIGYMGIETSTSGMRLVTPDMVLEVGRNPIYGADTLTGAAVSMLSYIRGPFDGFSPIPQGAHWWYDTPLGDSFWTIATVLYWIFWLNMMLGVSNALPAFPFDGGFIFQGGLSSLLQRLGMRDEKRREDIAARVAGHMSIVMVVMLVVVIAAVLF
ncbi:MAG: site-2 protease family protein [Methanomassiliicoccaceae archaeon]|nr:site-2 protease family protein [Methanomassiliicoccaceae archaeon]